jgi:hypothetical protein
MIKSVLALCIVTIVSVFKINAANLLTEPLVAADVANVAALVKAVKPAATPDEIESMLTSAISSFTANGTWCDSSIGDIQASVVKTLGRVSAGQHGVPIYHENQANHTELCCSNIATCFTRSRTGDCGVIYSPRCRANHVELRLSDFTFG